MAAIDVRHLMGCDGSEFPFVFNKPEGPGSDFNTPIRPGSGIGARGFPDREFPGNGVSFPVLRHCRSKAGADLCPSAGGSRRDRRSHLPIKPRRGALAQYRTTENPGGEAEGKEIHGKSTGPRGPQGLVEPTRDAADSALARWSSKSAGGSGWARETARRRVFTALGKSFFR